MIRWRPDYLLAVAPEFSTPLSLSMEETEMGKFAVEPVYFPLHLFPPPYRKSFVGRYRLANHSGISAGLIALLTVLLLSFCCPCVKGHQHHSIKRRWTNQWAVKIDGDTSVANKLAAKHGYTNLRQVCPSYYECSYQVSMASQIFKVLPGYYLFSHSRLSKRLTRSKRSAQFTLSREPKVIR